VLSGGSRPDPVFDVICGGSQIQARSGSEEERQIGSTSMRELPIACGVVTLKPHFVSRDWHTHAFSAPHPEK